MNEQLTEGGYILILMSVAALLGLLIGWLWFRISYARRFRVLQDRYNEQMRKYNQLQNDYLALKASRRNEDQQSPNGEHNTPFEEKLRQTSDAQTMSGTVVKTKNSKEAETLARIKEKAKDLDFERIGVATADEKDDLKQIKGIGPFIEKKLHSLGIYTFRQVSNFDEELEDKINDAIEFFPGRIRRDKWAQQAKKLVEKE